MEPTVYCESCGMPLDQSTLYGTEKDGSASNTYCTFCYSDGAFTNPGITLAKMRSFVIEKMKEEQIASEIIEAAVARLPQLKRWKSESAEDNNIKLVAADMAILNEKHPLEKPPSTESIVISEEELDIIADEELEDIQPFEPPEPGEGP